MSKTQALEIASTRVDSLLGLTSGDDEEIDSGALVVTKGGDLLSFEGKVVAIMQKELGVIHLFEQMPVADSNISLLLKRCKIL